MAMPTADEVIVEFEARVGKYEADLRRSAATFERVTQTQQRQMVALERQIALSSGKIGSAFKGLAALFGAQQITNALDSYTRFTNQLKVAGLEGASLAETQERLFGVAQQNGVELEAVGTLYSRAAQNQKELGASTKDLIDLTKAVSASLRISGTSTNEASGALLQLGQALGSPRVQAEEFNSLIDTMQPLLREASKYIEGTGNSLAGLTAKIKDQQGPGVSNVELFRAITKALADLEKTASNSTLTISGAYTNLSNAITKYAGEADRANGVSLVITGTLNGLANNLDTVAEALAVIATVMGVRYVAAAGASATSSIALAAANTRAALTAEALAGATYQANAALLGEASAARLAAASVTSLSVAQGMAARTGGALLAAVGGPVGAAVLALGAGVAVLSARQAEAQASSESLSAAIADQASQFDAARQKKAQAAAETNNLTKKERDALTATANLTGEANLLAQAWGRVAAQAKQAAIEQAKAALSSARVNRNQAQAALDRRAAQEAHNPANQPSGSAVGVIGRFTRSVRDTLFPGAQAEAAKAEKKERDNLNAAIKNEAAAREAYTDVINTPLNDFKAQPVAGQSGDDNSKALAKHRKTLADLEKLKAGASGKDLATINKKIERERAIISNLEKGVGETAAIAAASGSAASHAQKSSDAERDLSRLRQEELQAKLDLATSAEQRAELQRQILTEERKERVAEIKANKDLTDAQRKAALAAIDRLYGAQGENGEIVVQPGRYGQRITRDLEIELARQAQDAADERFRADQEILRNQYDLAESSAERKRLALASIDLEERYQRAQLQAIIDLEGANSAEGRRAQAAIGVLGEVSDSRRAAAERANQSPLEAYRNQLDRDDGETRDLVEGYVVDELQYVRDSIRSGIEKQIGIKDPLLSGLLNMLIEDVLIKPITEALSQAGSSGGGIGGFFSSLAGSLFGGGRAIGGAVKAGTPYMVGESGREMFVPQQAGVVVPNHRLSARSDAATINQQISIDARNSVTPEGFARELLTLSGRQAQQAAGAMGKVVTKAMPARLAQYQRDGT